MCAYCVCFACDVRAAAADKQLASTLLFLLLVCAAAAAASAVSFFNLLRFPVLKPQTPNDLKLQPDILDMAVGVCR